MTQQNKLIMASAAAVIALTAGLHTTVQAQASKPAHGAGHSANVTTSAGSTSSGAMDMKAMMKENNDKMAAMSMTGKPDVDFAMMMRVHHQGAIQMSEAQLKTGKDAEMKKMARKIIADQRKEIAQIDRFLAKQGHPVGKAK